MKILLVEPPKQPWFIMGEYIPPPLGLLCLAGYLEAHNPQTKIQVMDCQAEEAEWDDVKERIRSFKPDLVAPSTVSSCNAEITLRTVTLAKEIDKRIFTVAGGPHFSVLAQEVLAGVPQLDFIVRGEGEQTLLELIQALESNRTISQVNGLSFRHNGKVVHTPNRLLIKDLNTLPFPGYHFVREHMLKYRFPAGKDLPYALVEGGRGCNHSCSFCTQWRYWGKCRRKSPQRVADEFEYLYREFGSRFLWLTDDYIQLDNWMETLCDELLERGITEDLMWFFQTRADEIIAGKALLPKLRETGMQWIMTGLESHDPKILKKYQKGIEVGMGKEAIELLKENEILAQTTAIIGHRHDSHETIEAFREWINDLDPDIAVFMTMTPYPGTPKYKEALVNGWIEDPRWERFDMVHAIMPTEHLTREEVQNELYATYRAYYGWRRRISGVLARNKVKRTYYRHMMRKGFLATLKGLFRF
ncbi:MAG: B12-binding domain-containing radical SAM protein [Candidatus Odinarchaeota archaeon]